MSHSLSIDVDALTAAAASTTSRASSSGKTLTVQAASSARIKFNTKSLYVSAVRETVGRGQRFRITNVGGKSLKLDSNSIKFSGADAGQFALVSGTLPRTLKPGHGASFTIALKPSASASTSRVLTAALNVRAAGSSTVLGKIDVRGIATTGRGGDDEPSLARLMDLFRLSIDVGDTDPNTTALDLGGSGTDQVAAQRFVKAGSGPVELETLAVYLSDSDTLAGRFGYYEPGSPDTRKELFAVLGIDAQNVKPTVSGATRFDPGSSPFSLWGEAPIFRDTNGNPREIYQEDALNTWESNAAKQNKVRVYPLQEGGKTVAHSYVVTFEDWDVANDQNDYVVIVRNVDIASSSPEIGLIAQGGQPDSTRLVMNRVETQQVNYYSDFHDTATVRIVNTGTSSLSISSIGVSGGSSSDFDVTSGGGSGTLAPGATRDVTVQFVAHAGAGLHSSSLVIHSNDSDEATTTVALAGVWQQYAEADPSNVADEPSLQTLINALGYRVSVVNSGQHLDNKGKTEAVGDEVLSAYWRAADENLPVTMQELGGWHQTNTASYVGWYDRGNPWYYITDPRYDAAHNGDENRLFRMYEHDTQTFFQRSSADLTKEARANFSPDGAFGLRVDGEMSDDALNIQQPGDLGGHHIRFYPVRDAQGDLVANSYLMVLDFSSINFDYNDHIFLLQNIRPVDRTDSVEAIGGYSSSGGVVLDWNDVEEARGYRVYRSNKSSGTYSRVGDDVLDLSTFTDSSAKKGSTWYYRVVAINANGKESTAINTSVRRV